MGLSGLNRQERWRREPARLVNGTTRRTPCAVGAGVPPTTSRRRLAPPAATPPPRPAATAGLSRPAGEDHWHRQDAPHVYRAQAIPQRVPRRHSRHQDWGQERIKNIHKNYYPSPFDNV